MYEQVYFHKTTRSAEKLIQNIFLRLKELIDKGKKEKIGHVDNCILEVLTGNINIENYLKLDDFMLITYINKWASESEDELLRYLCGNFINRRLYKLVAETENMQLLDGADYKRVFEFFREKNLDEKYYFVEDSYIDVAYKDDYLFGEKRSEDAGHIWLIDKFGSLVDLGEASHIVKALRNNLKAKYRVYCDRSVFQEFKEKNIIGGGKSRE